MAMNIWCHAQADNSKRERKNRLVRKNSRGGHEESVKKRGERHTLIPNIMPINFSSTFRQRATWFAGILITDCPEAPLTTERPVQMAERNGQRGSTCFSSQMEDNTSNNGPRPFSATTTTTTTTAEEYCQHQRRLLLFGLCGLTGNYRVCFREDSCHDKVFGRPFHTYAHTIRGKYSEEHTHLSTAHTHGKRFGNLIQGRGFAQSLVCI